MQVIKTGDGNFHGNLTRGSSFKLIIRFALFWPHLIGVMRGQSLHPLNPLTCPPTPRLRRTLQNVLYAPSIVFIGKGSKIFCDSGIAVNFFSLRLQSYYHLKYSHFWHNHQESPEQMAETGLTQAACKYWDRPTQLFCDHASCNRIPVDRRFL